MSRPTLSIGDLLKIGLLGEERAFRYVVIGDMTFLLTWYGKGQSLTTVSLASGRVCKSFVEVEWVPRTICVRPYLRCGETNKLSTKLEFDGTVWVRASVRRKQKGDPGPLSRA